MQTNLIHFKILCCVAHWAHSLWASAQSAPVFVTVHSRSHFVKRIKQIFFPNSFYVRLWLELIVLPTICSWSASMCQSGRQYHSHFTFFHFLWSRHIFFVFNSKTIVNIWLKKHIFTHTNQISPIFQFIFIQLFSFELRVQSTKFNYPPENSIMKILCTQSNKKRERKKKVKNTPKIVNWEYDWVGLGCDEIVVHGHDLIEKYFFAICEYSALSAFFQRIQPNESKGVKKKKKKQNNNNTASSSSTTTTTTKSTSEKATKCLGFKNEMNEQ